jgi:hypothetical protein
MHKLFVVLLLLSLSSLAQDKHIANITSEGFDFLIDTTAFKQEVRDIIFAKEDSLHFYDKISVVRYTTFGVKKEVYYYVLLEDFSTNYSTVKWLEKRGDSLIMINDFKDENYFQFLYICCQGVVDCIPKVGWNQGQKKWTCGDSFICIVDGSCITSKVAHFAE